MYLLDNNKYLINLISYTYPKGVKAEGSKKYIQVGKDEVLAFFEIGQNNSIDLSFKFGERFKNHIDDYAKENKLQVSSRNIEFKIYKTDKASVEKYFKASFVHYDMMKFVLETIDVDLIWHNAPEITKVYFAKQVIKPERIQHKVATGELYPKIAEKYGTTLEKIVELNDMQKNSIGKYPFKIGKILDIDSLRTEDINLKFEPVTSAKLGDTLYMVCETKNLRDKMVNMKLKQGKNKGLAEKDQEVEMFLHNAFTSNLDMTIGKGAKSSSYKNRDEYLDVAYGKIVLIPNDGNQENKGIESEKNKPILKKWNDIINNLQTKSTFLYLYSESKDDGNIFYDGSDKGEFLEVISIKKEMNKNETSKNTCGIQYRNKITCTRYGKEPNAKYGPLYTGDISIINFKKWNEYISENKLTKTEFEIICGMSVNEGNLDAVQSYDSEILTFGAMQKTINIDGYGELPIQLWEFKESYPDNFKELLDNCGWTIKKEGTKYRAYYRDETAIALKSKIRTGFTKDKFGEKVPSVPIEPFIALGKSELYQSKQIDDFITRLRSCLEEVVVEKYHKNKLGIRIPDKEYLFKTKDIFKSKLGRATLLDQSVNRPAFVRFNVGEAMNRFFSKHPNVSKNLKKWGNKHSDYEKEIIEDYGITRKGTDMKKRFLKMKSNNYLQ